MATIDVGPGAIERVSYKTYGSTLIVIDNPANDTGILDTFEIYAHADMTGCVMGTFSGSSTSYTPRDYESIGNVTAGSQQTFTGKNCDVSSGDFLGVYYDNGRCKFSGYGFSGVYSKTGNQFSAGTQTYTLGSGDTVSIYATGATAAPGAIPTHLFQKPFRHILIR